MNLKIDFFWIMEGLANEIHANVIIFKSFCDTLPKKIEIKIILCNFEEI